MTTLPTNEPRTGHPNALRGIGRTGRTKLELCRGIRGLLVIIRDLREQLANARARERELARRLDAATDMTERRGAA